MRGTEEKRIQDTMYTLFVIYYLMLLIVARESFFLSHLIHRVVSIIIRNGVS